MQQTRNPCASEPKEPGKQRKQGRSDKADPARLPALGSEDLVGMQTMACKIKYTILALAVTLLLSGLLLAQGYGDDDDDDGGYYRGRGQAQAQQYGYENGYRDGLRRGREEGRENDPFDYQTPDGRQASRGYENWMGSEDAFQCGYRNGYRAGFKAGNQNSRGRGGDVADNDRPRLVGRRGRGCGHGGCRRV